MSEYKFQYPIQVRYGDLDPQWHVNNAHFLMFLEQSRFAYLVETGLFDGKSFFDLGLIVADVHVAYLAPIDMHQKVVIGVRINRIGTKSLTFEYEMKEEGTGVIFSKAETVMVAYDYKAHQSMPVPQEWRKTISAYEQKEF
jgi:acyl-CoA thioester hydrolase